MILASEPTNISAVAWIEAVRRVSRVPILVGTIGREREAASYVRAGATGFISRPYRGSDLRDLVKGLRQSGDVPAAVGRLRVRALGVQDAGSFTAWCRGDAVDLPLKEFELLQFLMLNQHRAVAPDEIADALWGTAEGRPAAGAVKTHVRRLRNAPR